MSVSVLEAAEETTPISPPECPICGRMPHLRLGSLAHRPHAPSEAWRIGTCVGAFTSTWPREAKLIWQWCQTRGLLFCGQEIFDFDRRREHLPVTKDRRRR